MAYLLSDDALGFASAELDLAAPGAVERLQLILLELMMKMFRSPINLHSHYLLPFCTILTLCSSFISLPVFKLSIDRKQ
jgi:hypothetical protein